MTTPSNIKAIIQEQLPIIIAEDPSIRDFILRTVSEYYAPKQETESKFDRILAELQRDREEQARKWDENNRRLDDFIHQQNQKWDENNRKWEENSRRLDDLIYQQNQKWDENNQKWEENNQRWNENNQRWNENNQRWDENNRKWEENSRRLDDLIYQQNQKWWEQHRQNQETLAEIKKLHKKYDSAIGALGSRWGLYSEASFRNALAGILQESFGVEVLNLNDYDQDGIVFGRPDQVEIDVIIKNGLVIVCEIKSSIDKAGMYIFDRKVEFYQQHYHRQVNRKIVISPMVDSRALPVAQNLGIEVYSYAEDVPLEN